MTAFYLIQSLLPHSDDGTLDGDPVYNFIYIRFPFKVKNDLPSFYQSNNLYG